MARTVREILAAAVLSAVVAVPAIITVKAQSVQGLDLIAALKKTPGVLGVDAGQMMSGKQVIFAWFENQDIPVIFTTAYDRYALEAFAGTRSTSSRNSTWRRRTTVEVERRQED